MPEFKLITNNKENGTQFNRSRHAFGHEHWYCTSHTAGQVSIRSQSIMGTYINKRQHVPVSSSILRYAECNNHPDSLGMCAGIPAYRKHTTWIRKKRRPKAGELLTVGPHSQQSLLTPLSNLCTTRISDMNGWWGRFNLLFNCNIPHVLAVRQHWRGLQSDVGTGLLGQAVGLVDSFHNTIYCTDDTNSW